MCPGVSGWTACGSSKIDGQYSLSFVYALFVCVFGWMDYTNKRHDSLL